MLIALTTSSLTTAARMMLAWEMPGRHNPAQIFLRDADFALAERSMR
jgi:hypothetical protein